MSRIGKQPVKVPNGVTVKLNGPVLEVNGPKGALKRDTFGRIKISQTGSEIAVQPAIEDGANFWGLYRTLLANMVEGVTTGYSRHLELVGTGYRAAMTGKNLTLTVGYSHPVNMTPPAGVAFEVDKAGKVVVAGPDKELVGRVAAQVRAVRAPEPYHGKGIRYVGEVIATKVGKSSGKK